MLKVGLTGGIGSGKTTVADLFAACGVPVLDADRIARDLVEPGQPALHEIERRFGAELVKQGRLDRARLRSLVFASPEDRRWLESLLHPLVFEEFTRRLAGLAAPYCILVIPLLLETGRSDFVDRVLVVDCPEDQQRERVMARDGLSRAEVDAILASQVGRRQRLAAADDVVENTGGRKALARRIDELHRSFLSMSGDRGSAPRPPGRG